MLSPKTQTNLANAKGYFEEHLCAGDYYAENCRVQGVWIGAGAVLLALEGTVTREAFLSLCENRYPASGKRLTQRHKTARIDKAGGGESANRRVFFDFTISPPKSVSIAALVAGDLRIVAAHREALCAAVSELEGFASARVRECGANRDRRTGNIVAALFEHETSRALDPHLHTHCIVFNATQDAEDGRWKALQNHDMLAAQKYVENVYYHELARALRVLGYTVVNSPRGDFEIAEVPEALRARFSKRHAQIDAQTATLLEEHPELHGANVQAIREYLAHKKRDRKVRGVSTENLRAFWAEQLSVAEREALHPSTCHAAPFCKESAVEALDWAEAHLFERRSVVHKHELWRHALAKTRGSDVTVAELKRETEARSYLRAEQDKISRRGVLAREWAIVEMARDGIGRYSPLGRSYLLDANKLAPDQLRAFRQILRSRDFITLFRGGAGTGKSFVLRRIQDALRLAGHVTQTAAPQRQQVIDLDRNGLQEIRTVAEFILRGVLPWGAVVIVDEAGQIGGQQMFDLLRLVKGANGRVILSGDTRQHGPVEASDALRAIERYSGLRPIQLDQIRRQDPARARKAEERERVTIYRQAVEAASAGDLVTSLEHLERLGAVKECGIGEQRERLIEAYVGFAARGETAIVVSQTRAEVRAINEAVRAGLRRCGALTGADTSVTALEQVDLTTAQKADTRHYPAESCIVFNREFRGCPRGSKGAFVAVTPAGVVVEVDGRIKRVPQKFLDRITVCRLMPLAVCSGDRLQLKANALATRGQRLANGEIITVSAVLQDGSIRLDDGRTLPPNYRQFQRGYAVTSYGSQGKTVDHVLFADAAVRAATNAQQWYVTISRGRKSVQIFTTDREELRQFISRSGERELALDLANTIGRSRRVREEVLGTISRGRELARRLCRATMRTWISAFIKSEMEHFNETPTRKQQQSVRASVLAT